MSNNLAQLNDYLRWQLRDTAEKVWDTQERDDLLTWAVASLWPRYSRPLDPTSTTITLVDQTYYYSLPSGVRSVQRVDLVDSGSNELGPVNGRAWEIVGDALLGTGKIHLSPQINDAFVDGTIRLNGMGAYDTSTNLVPDLFVPLVLAKARAEAYRRMGSKRQQFEQWLTANQGQNVTVNELLQLINEADSEIARLERSIPRTWALPVQGRLG